MLKYIYRYVIENDAKDYNLIKEDIYIPDFTGEQNSFRIKGTKFIFENENNISDLIKPTEDIFNKGIETSEINGKDFIDPQIEVVENILKKQPPNFLTSRFFYMTKAT